MKEGSEAAPDEADQLRYLTTLQEERAAGPARGTRGKLAWIETKAKEAKELGRVLGLLAMLDCISINEEDETEIVWNVVVPPDSYKQMLPKDKKGVDRKILAAYAEGLETGSEEGEAEKEDRKTEK